MKVLIVDDEPLARRGLRGELARIPGVVCVGEVATRDRAVAAVESLRPDLVLLDVHLGRGTGFDAIARIDPEVMPLFVFVSAYPVHALRAFDVHAVDYVTKPVDPIRLREAIERAAYLLELRRSASLADRLERMLLAGRGPTIGEAAPAVLPLDRIAVPEGARLAFVEIRAIDWFEARDNYVAIHTGKRVHLIRATLAAMATRIGAAPGGPWSEMFVRARRSALVNAQAIVAIERFSKGMYTLHLRNGATVTSSRYRQRAIQRLLRRTTEALDE